MTIKLVLFDIGGVLIDYSTAFETASKAQDIKLEKFWEGFDKYDTKVTTGKITPQELYKNILKDNNSTANPDYDFFTSWLNDYKVIKPTFDFVYKVATKYKVGLLSNIYDGMVPKMIATGLLPDVSYSYKFVSADIGLKKPDDDIYAYVEKVTTLAPHELFYVDDRDDYLDPAIKRGWQTYKFPTTNPETGITELNYYLKIN